MAIEILETTAIHEVVVILRRQQRSHAECDRCRPGKDGLFQTSRTYKSTRRACRNRQRGLPRAEHGCSLAVRPFAAAPRQEDRIHTLSQDRSGSLHTFSGPRVRCRVYPDRCQHSRYEWTARMVRRARGVGLVDRPGWPVVGLHRPRSWSAARRIAHPSRDHNRLRNALANAVSSSLGPQCHRRSSRAPSWRFARHHQAACRVLSSTAAWMLCACTCPRDLLRFQVSIAFTKLFHFFIAARFSGM